MPTGWIFKLSESRRVPKETLEKRQMDAAKEIVYLWVSRKLVGI